MNVLAIAVAWIASLAIGPASIPNAWQHWSSARNVNVEAPRATDLVRLKVPLGVYAKAQPGLQDIRIIEGDGAEVPYAIDTPQERVDAVWTRARLSDFGFVLGKFTQVVADLGTADVIHNEVRVTANPGSHDYFAWASLEASDDGHAWRIILERSPIYEFQSEGFKGQDQINFSDTRSRWLRMKILDGQRQFSISDVEIAHNTETDVQREAVPILARLSPRSPPHQSWWEADFGTGNFPLSSIRFSATQMNFYRPVSVSTSDDGNDWNDTGQGNIYRYPGAEQLNIDVEPSGGRHWRVTVHDRNDAPIQGLRIAFLITPRYVTFRTRPGHSYVLLYGNNRATAPEYDFSTLTTLAQRSAAQLVVVESEISNASYVSPEPWTERHGWLLWVALLIAVLVVGALAVRLMR